MKLSEILQNNAVQLLLIFVSMVVAWTILNQKVMLLTDQQIVYAQEIKETKSQDQQILVMLARMETKQDNIEKTILEIKEKLK